MYLLGDIGNTEIKICLFNENKKLQKKIKFETNLITNKFLIKKFSSMKLKKYNIKKVIFCSVVPIVYLKIKNILIKKFNLKSNELKNLSLSKLVNIKVNKKQIGSDRLSNALSVIDNKNNYIIIDFGTATTFDVVIKNNYLGGVISPGINLSLKTLVSKATMIPKVKLKSINKVLGKNTLEAVRSGFYWGYSGLISNIIKKIFKQTQKKYKIILTGGLSYLFKKSLPYKVTINRNLTINGLLKVVHLIN
jgi:type III pantothenate kinase